MIDLISLATKDLTVFLNDILPKTDSNWWEKSVIERLSFQQQRIIREKNVKSLEQLDFAALLRILDQNWYEITSIINLPREARNWLKELQNVRNKWAHLSSEDVPANELYRDADTLERLLKTLGSKNETIKIINDTKQKSLAEMQQKELKNSVSAEDSPTNNNLEKKQVSLFRVGDVVCLRSDENSVFPIIEIIDGVEKRYKVFQNNTIATYYESQLQSKNLPEIKSEIINKKELEAYLTSSQILSPSFKELFSLRMGRVNFVPYQYRPVMKLIRSDRPRILIADEVGVGKTIEAGLIIKELQARMDISSILVMCPKALVAEKKWQIEMKRFNEDFSSIDGSLLRSCIQETYLEGEWPHKYSKAIMPFSLFDSDNLFGKQGRGKSKDYGLLELDPPPKFDLVIVDEAHHIRNQNTLLHNGVRFLCDNAQAVLLLTATPVQLGSEDLFTLLNVLRPDLVIDKNSFSQMAAPNIFINKAISCCRTANKDWNKEAIVALESVANTEWGRMFIRENPLFQKTYDGLKEHKILDNERIKTIKNLEEIYTFSSIINRTRRRDIGNFTTRKPETIIVEFTKDQKYLHDKLLEIVGKILAYYHGERFVKFLMTTIRRQASSCIYALVPTLSDILNKRLSLLDGDNYANDEYEDFLYNNDFIDEIKTDISKIIEDAKTLDPYDPKAEAFIKVLLDKHNLENNKAMVFSTFRHTLNYLYEKTKKANIRVALIHGDIKDEDRADLRKRFSMPKENENAIDVLLSSEVGCEGLDFQFCDLLINYDLPWNPMRIEQRIGRIDRYGQKSETVAIINLVTPNTVDGDIYERCLWRIGVFQSTVGGNEEILGEINQEIKEIAENFNLSDEERKNRLQQLADNKIRLIQEEQNLEEKQSEFFGLNIPKSSWQNDLDDAENSFLSPNYLQNCLNSYLCNKLKNEDNHISGEKDIKNLKLSQEARDLLLSDLKAIYNSNDPQHREWEKWLKGNKPSLSITFEQEIAKDNPDIVYLSVFHPLIKQSAKFFEIKEIKKTKLALEDADLKSGTYYFAIYKWLKSGIKNEEMLVSITDDIALEQRLLNIISQARNADIKLELNESILNKLEDLHYQKWLEKKNEHFSLNKELVEHKMQSLTISHRARCKTIEAQLEKANNDKIKIMKEAELARANADFDRRMKELEQTSNSGDIRATPIIFGVIEVSGKM
ncbi:MAG: helicase-related protein [Alphaproteobacteria bacterium]